MNFYFFDPGTLDPEAGRRGPGCQNLAFQRFDPMILCSFSWRIRWTILENHSSKQMPVYNQFSFFFFQKSKIQNPKSKDTAVYDQISFLFFFFQKSQIQHPNQGTGPLIGPPLGDPKSPPPY